MAITARPSRTPLLRLAISAFIWLLLTACGQAPAPVLPLPDGMPESLQQYVSGLHKSATADPSDYRKQTELARTYAAHEFWDHAISGFQAATVIDPSKPQPWFHWALAEQRRGDADRAAGLHERIAEDFPRYPPNLDRLGNLRLKRGDLGGAEDAYATLVEITPNHPNGHIGLAQVRLAEKNFESAASAARHALSSAPSDRRAHYALGLAYRGQGKTELARSSLARGAGSVPSFVVDRWETETWRLAHTPAVALEYARRAAAESQFQRATNLAQKVLSWEPENIDALNVLAVAQIAQNQPREACLALAPALAHDSQHLDTRLNLASCYGAMGNSQAALSHANLAIEIQPNSARAHHLRAKALMGGSGTSNLDEAMSSLQRSLVLDPYEEGAERELAFLKLNAGQLDQAQQLFEGLTVSDPNAPWGHLGLSEVAFRQGNTALVRKELAKARKIAPTHPGVASLQSRLSAIEQP